MAVLILIHATERSVLEGNAPTTAAVTAAFRYAERGIYTVDGQPHQRTAANGGWVGPAPRVTRSAPVGAFVTQAAWVWQLTDAQQVASGLQTAAAQQAFAERLAADVHTSLRAGASPGTLGDFWTVTHAPYNPTVNGPLSWWQSGDATRATFVNDFPQLAQRTLPMDNPVGPTPERADTGAGKALTALAWIAGAVAVTVLAVQVGPLLSAASKALPDRKPPKTENPRRR